MENRWRVARYTLAFCLSAFASFAYVYACGRRRRKLWAKAIAAIPPGQLEQFTARLRDASQGRPTPAPLDAVQVLADVQAFLSGDA
jgi:hypothetical protein